MGPQVLQQRELVLEQQALGLGRAPPERELKSSERELKSPGSERETLEPEPNEWVLADSQLPLALVSLALELPQVQALSAFPDEEPDAEQVLLENGYCLLYRR